MTLFTRHPNLYNSLLRSPHHLANVNGFLTRLASTAVLTPSENNSIARSVAFLERKANSYFKNNITELGVFGSYSRGTILPRESDEESDVDYMIVFDNATAQPQTYLDRLRRFVDERYSQSEIHQSHPTIQLELNHIRFELVPAKRVPLFGLHIPSKNDGYATWQSTSPLAFNQELVEANVSQNRRIRPLIRVIKLWNAKAGRPFESFDLERRVVEQNYWFCEPRLCNMFYSVVDGLHLGLFSARWKLDALERLKTRISQAREYETKGDLPGAVQILAPLFPEM